jgi:hypothetical protein
MQEGGSHDDIGRECETLSSIQQSVVQQKQVISLAACSPEFPCALVG